MEKDGNGITLTRLVFTSTLIWSSGFLIFALIEGILRFLKGSTPWLFMLWFTIFLYFICGIGIGFVFGFLLVFFRKLFNPLWQKIKAIPCIMSCCMGFLVFLFAGIFINKQVGVLYSKISPTWINLALVFLGLFLLTTFYVLFVHVVDKRKWFSFYCALSVGLYTFMVVGLFINEHVLSGSFSVIDGTRVLANIGVVVGSSLLYLIMYYLFVFLSRQVGTRRQPRYLNSVIVMLLLVLLGGVILYSIKRSPSQKHLVKQNGNTDNNKPNIILITMDTTRVDHLSCYGYHRNTTPNLDELAQESVVFTNAYATSPWTLPSHASIFTGMFSAKHGSRYDWETMQSNWPVSLNKNYETMAEILAGHGYKTAGVIGGFWVRPIFGLAQGFEYYDHELINVISDLEHFTLYRVLNRWISLEDVAARKGLNLSRIASQINTIVFSWLKNNFRSSFFLFINYYDPHHPYLPPEHFYLLFEEDNQQQMTEAEKYRHEIIQRYDGEIAYLDFQMGKLFEELKKLGIYDSTMIVITSDHGEFFGEHDLWYHSHELYEEVLKIPLIIKFPTAHSRKGIYTNRVSLVDILPTVLNFLELPLPRDVQGVDLFKGGSRVMSEIYRHIDAGDSLKADVFVRELKSLFSKNYKYIKEFDKESESQDELYDIENDPGELQNLIEKTPEKAKEMEEELMELLPSTDLQKTTITPMILNPAIRDGLEALGYLQK